MVFVVYIIIASCGTEVPAIHLIFGLTIETTFFQYREWQRVCLVWISIQPWVCITHRSIIHRTISPSLITLISDCSGIGRCRILISTQYCEFYLRDWLIFQLSLELHVNHIQTQIVVFQFTENIEWSVVTHIEFIRIHCTRSVQRIRIWVDIKITRHLTRHLIYRLRSSTRSTLLTIGSISYGIERQFL